MNGPTQSEALRRILRADRADLHTGGPGRVRSFDADAQTVEVEIGWLHVIEASDDLDADETEEYPILVDVPVHYPRGGGFAISWPLRAGDWVWIVFGEVDLGQWRATGDVADPGVATRHGLSGAIALAGIHHHGNPNGNATTNTLRLEHEGGVVLEITGSEVLAGGSKALAEADDVKAHLQAISTALDTIATAAGVTSSYVYATVLGTKPIATTTTKGD